VPAERTGAHQTQTRASSPRKPILSGASHPLDRGGKSIEDRIAAHNWTRIAANINRDPYAILNAVLTEEEYESLAATYEAKDRFRSRITMKRYNFGRGEYQYFAYPLPETVYRFRTALYPPLAGIVNRWNETLRIDLKFSAGHAGFLDRCHRAGQTKPTPFLLQYGPGDFTGGEFILTEQRPRMQSRVEVVAIGQGDCVIFPVRNWPVQGTRGSYRVNMRHGVSPA
jgi:hypothetical protein